MPLNKEIKKTLIIGSGPIVIGQAAEFDYAGTQACLELKKAKIETVLINSNPATIMTDKTIADHVYIEALTLENVKQICLKEKVDSVLANMGGQIALNLAIELYQSGFLKKHNIKLIGVNPEAIINAEDRELFKKSMLKINQPCIPSSIATTINEAIQIATNIGYPIIIRPAFTMGGAGGGIANNKEELIEIATNGLQLSKIHQILVEKSVYGYKEIEFEVIRDSNGNCITVCNMENFDPVGVHTGDSIVVSPCQTLNDCQLQMLRTASIDIINELKIEGGCNVQYALHPENNSYYVIEVNPRVSRSSALASKVVGYPIARIATKIAIGYLLNEIDNPLVKSIKSCHEPIIDYVVVKIPKWPFTKLQTTNRELTTQMKATGEVMAISNNFNASLLKAVRSLEEKYQDLLPTENVKNKTNNALLKNIATATDIRLLEIMELLARNTSAEKISNVTKINLFFINQLKKLNDIQNDIKQKITPQNLLQAKKNGLTDKTIAKLTNKKENEILALRKKHKILPVFKRIDSCAGEFDANAFYYYSIYGSQDNEVVSNNNSKKVLLLGSGPIRIGQGIEFDYCTVHAINVLKKLGYEVIVVNSNPETLSTDFDIASKLYFEPLNKEDISNIVAQENITQTFIQFGGQTPINLMNDLIKMGVKILGTDKKGMDGCEDREIFNNLLIKNKIKKPDSLIANSIEEVITCANKLGYPILVRPSYVIGGQGMNIFYDEKTLKTYLKNFKDYINDENPILVDKYLEGTEIEIDAICDGKDVFIPGVMQHVEPTGIHSGDSISLFPSNLSLEIQNKIYLITKKIAQELKIIGLMNIQFIFKDNELYIIEVNPRASRTVPYISKVTNIETVNIAIQVILGKKLPHKGIAKNNGFPYAVKMPIFSNEKIKGADVFLSPEMKSTGEVLGIDKDFYVACYKAFQSLNIDLKNEPKCLVSIADRNKKEFLNTAKLLVKNKVQIYATPGTQKFLKNNGINSELINKDGEQLYKNIFDNKINFIINTSTVGKNEKKFGYNLRRVSSENKLPLFTSLSTIDFFLTANEQIKNKKITPFELK
ncbi:MAG: carbamoyl-phosphate synthase large subunit [Mycoplasmataceae bacterium]|jgi:carbamoyl-phosphate synthase large subunit|nr:carbamoyl-phosphate synthase large subunit [Mycoplasmataceae bacterium]